MDQTQLPITMYLINEPQMDYFDGRLQSLDAAFILCGHQYLVVGCSKKTATSAVLELFSKSTVTVITDINKFIMSQTNQTTSTWIQVGDRHPLIKQVVFSDVAPTDDSDARVYLDQHKPVMVDDHSVTIGRDFFNMFPGLKDAIERCCATTYYEKKDLIALSQSQAAEIAELKKRVADLEAKLEQTDYVY